jgi:hypothetical protein
MKKEHYLKTDSKFFADIAAKRKKFEIRRDDRNYQMGDLLILGELKGKTLSGWCIKCHVSYVLESSDFPDGIKEGYVIMGIDVVNNWFDVSLAGKAELRGG